MDQAPPFIPPSGFTGLGKSDKVGNWSLTDLVRIILNTFVSDEALRAGRRLTSGIQSSTGPQERERRLRQFWGGAVFVGQSFAHASSLERCGTTHVQHLVCRTGVVDWMSASFSDLNDRGSSLLSSPGTGGRLLLSGSHVKAQVGHDIVEHEIDKSPGFFVISLGRRGNYGTHVHGHTFACPIPTT